MIEDGKLGLPGHGVGPVADAAVCVIERILAGSEPMNGPLSEYVIDGATGIDTAPAPVPVPFDPGCG